MPAVMINGECGKELNGGKVPHITVAFIKGSATSAAECMLIVDALKKEAADRKVEKVDFVLEKKHNPWNKSYPLKLTDDNRWLYRFNSKSHNPRPPHVEMIGAQSDLTGKTLTIHISSIHFQ